MIDSKQIRECLLHPNYLTLIENIGLNAIPTLIDILRSAEFANLHENGVKSLYHLDSKLAIQTLIEDLFSPDDKVRLTASNSLKVIGSQAIDPIIEYLGSTDPKIRYQAAYALADVKNPQAIEALYHLMKTDQDLQLCTWYAHFLIRMNDSYVDEAIDTLYRLASNGPSSDEEIWVQMSAVEKIAWTDDPRKIQFLIDLLEDSHDSIRALAIQYLGDTGDIRAVPSLIECSSDNSIEIRLYAVEALGNLNDKRAVAPLIERLRDSEMEVQKQAISSLGQLGDKQALPALMKLEKQLLDDEARLILEVALRNLGYP